MLDLEPARHVGHFTVLQIGATSLDLLQTDEEISQCHLPFLVDESECDLILQRILSRALPYWADPFRQQSGAINHWDDGHGIYVDDPNGHLMEVITRPYGSGGCEAKQLAPLRQLVAPGASG